MPGIDLTSWIAIVGPAGMAPDLVARVNALLAQALNTPSVKERIAQGHVFDVFPYDQDKRFAAAAETELG